MTKIPFKFILKLTFNITPKFILKLTLKNILLPFNEKRWKIHEIPAIFIKIMYVGTKLKKPSGNPE